jgi:hypothetical protein
MEHIETTAVLFCNFNNLKYSVHKIYVLLHFVCVCVCGFFCPVEQLITEYMIMVATTTHQKAVLCQQDVFVIHV